MKNRDRILSLLVSALLVSLVLTCVPYRYAESRHVVLRESMCEVALAGVAHDPIVIGNDSEFSIKATEESWDGEGSVSSPFIIEGFDIDLEGASGNCITIENTTVHFMIRDCYLTGSTQINNAGIRLWNVTNGNINNNEFFNNSYGIYGSANHSVVSDNIVNLTSFEGILMTQTYHTQILRNEFIDSNGGLRLSSGAYNEIRSNVVNVQSGYAVRISTSENSTISGNQCSGATIAGMLLSACYNISLENNQFFKSYRGLTVELSTHIDIVSSTFRENDDAGLYFYDSYVSRVIQCNISDNTNFGIIETTGSAANLIVWNTFVNNTGHIQDESVGNSHYEFNYYDDYTGSDINGDGYGEVPYVIPLFDEEDFHPLVYTPTAVEWVQAPTDQVIELGEAFYYDLNATSAAPINDWSIDENQHFMVDSEGVVRDKGSLSVGHYFVNIVAKNVYELAIVGGFSVIVEDTTDPVWITEARNKNYNYGNWIAFQIVAWDYAGIEAWTISDDENFTLIDEAYEETGIVTVINTHILNPGDYPILLEVFDVNGNSASMSFMVTVNVGGIGTGNGFDVGTVLSLAGIGIAVVAFLFGFIAFMNTRKDTAR